MAFFPFRNITIAQNFGFSFPGYAFGLQLSIGIKTCVRVSWEGMDEYGFEYANLPACKTIPCPYNNLRYQDKLLQIVVELNLKPVRLLMKQEYSTGNCLS